MRYLFGFMCVLALGVMGCGETAGTGGSGGSGGATGQEFPCTEQGIRDAIAEGGGPHFFECDGPTTIETDDTLVIDNDVVLDGAYNLTVDGRLSHRVFDVNKDVAAELRGIKVTGGWSDDGGGIYNVGSLTVTTCTVSNSETPFQGGGIRNIGELTVTNSTVSGNRATDGNGGGIHNSGTLTVMNSAVLENTAAVSGGGISNDGQLTLTESTVSGNAALGVILDSVGGGIYSYGNGSLSLRNSAVSDNSTAFKGGGIGGNGPLTLMNSSVSGNAGSQGGGIYWWSGRLTLMNSTLSGNVTEDDTGVFVRAGAVTLLNSTVSDSLYAQGIPGDPDSDPPRSAVRVSVLSTATLIDGECTQESDEVTWTSDGYNIESPGDTCGFDQLTDQVNVIADDLKLGPLQDNGGPTQTHALLPGSVAIDVIPAQDCVDADGEPLATDQRGEPRDSMCDVGAFEWSARDAALTSYCAAVLECFPDDESCEAEFGHLWIGSGGDLAACTSAKSELVECAALLDCDKLGEGSQAVLEECDVQLVAAWEACGVAVKSPRRPQPGDSMCDVDAFEVQQESL